MLRAASSGASPAPPPRRPTVLLLLWLQLQLSSSHSAGHLPQGCLCTADLVSCSGLDLQRPPPELPASSVTLDLSHNHLALLAAGSFSGLVRLETLRLAHNWLEDVQPGAFGNASGALLRHLDLSSNRLESLKRHHLLELPGLEELLLFNNRMVSVAGTALEGLNNLRKLYLSHNQLRDFPFTSIQTQSNVQLSLLDLSFNRLPRLPVEDVSALPPALQQGLYLHNNPLLCECSMYGLFRSWERRRFASVTSFRSEQVCLLYGIRGGSVRFLLHRRVFQHCNATATGSLSVQAGRRLLLHCVTALSGHAVSFHWVAPSGEYVVPPGNNQTLRMFANGSLEMMAAREQDSGIYWCLALDRQWRRNETWEVNVTVVLQRDADATESFNTGFTTLLGCVVSLLLVLMYLYLTPCRCPPRSKATPSTTATPGQATEAGAGTTQSSILSPTPPTTTEGPGRKISTNKHVVFLEPIREQQNGRLRAGPGVEAGHLGPSFLLGAEQQAPRQQRAETDSMVSIYSDTPIMFP